VIFSTGYSNFVVVTVETTLVKVEVVVVVNVEVVVCVTVEAIPSAHPAREDTQIISDVIRAEYSFFIQTPFGLIAYVIYIL
jgi:hypothetical protein